MNMSLLCRCGLVVFLLCAPAFAKDVPKPTKGALVLPRVPDVPLPQSIFNIPTQPSEGRNPFFPQSTIKVVIPKINRENPIDTTSSLVLNGITSPPKQTAMINGRTFGKGEEGEVRTAGGFKVMIKVEEIKSESAVIVVGGQRRELRLRAGV